MTRFRLSILEAMGLVMGAGLVLALVRIERAMVPFAAEGWVHFGHYLSVTILVIATCRAKYGRGMQADWWFGFALGGWTYHLFAGDMIWQWPEPTHLPDSLIAYLPDRIASLIPVQPSRHHPRHQIRTELTRVVQDCLVMCAAFVGGILSLVLSWRRSAKRRRWSSHETEIKLTDSRPGGSALFKPGP